MSNETGYKNSFISWLSSREVEQPEIDVFISNLEYINLYWRQNTDLNNNIWNLPDLRIIDSIIYMLTKSKSGNYILTVADSKKALLTLKKYLTDVKNSNDTTHIEWRTISLVDTKYDFQKKLESSTSFLKKKYKHCPASTLRQVQSENPEINFGYFNTWTKTLCGLSASKYLIELGLIVPKEEDKRNDSEKLAEAISMLKNKYSVIPAKSLSQVAVENTDISVSLINSWTKKIYGLTAKEYLVKNRIIVEKTDDSWRSLDTHSRQPGWDEYETALLVEACYKVLYENADRRLIIKNISYALRSRAIHLGMNIDEVFRNENGIALQMTKVIYLITGGAQGMPGAGAVYRDVVNLRKERPEKYKMVLNEALAQLKEISSDTEDYDDVKQLQDLASHHIDSLGKDAFMTWLENNKQFKKQSSSTLVNVIDEGSIYSLNHGLTKISFWAMKDDAQFSNVSVNLLKSKTFRMKATRSISSYIRAFKLYEEYLNSLIQIAEIESIKSQAETIEVNAFQIMKSNLNSVIDYLKTRYSVKLEYDRFEKPTRYKDDMLYKAFLSGKDVLWVYFIFTKRTKYISLECEPEYLSSLEKYSFNYDQIKIRRSHPCQKMFYTSLNDIMMDLPTICDAIDEYYINYDAEYNQEKASESHQRLYSKLYSAINVYDNPDGISISRLCELTGESDKGLIRQVITENNLACEVRDGIFLSYNNLGNFEGFDREKYIKTLLHRYRNGMSFDSIDYDIFRDTYSMLFDDSIEVDDITLEKQLKLCGIEYKNRLFPAEGLIDNSTKEKLFTYIDSSFAAGKKVIYYRAIMEDLSALFANCYSLTNEEILKKYLEFVSGDGKYYFSDSYFSNERSVSVDITKEISDCLLSSGKPMTIDDIASELSHIPKDQITSCLRLGKQFIWNSRSEYFHIDIFDINDNESDEIASFINDIVCDNKFAIWDSVWELIQSKMPYFIESNLYLSSYGIRNALEIHYSGRFEFHSQVISMPGKALDMRDVYQSFARQHLTFTADELENFSKELGSNIYLHSILEVSFRVNRNLFVSQKLLDLNVRSIDDAINSFLSKDYIRIREIDSFLSFPNVGYEWNEFLLESFVLSFSERFILVNNGISMKNVAGVIAKRNSKYTEFEDVCADVLANSFITLDKTNALNYLAETNMITRRSYKKLDSAIQKAKQIRERQK